MASLKTLRENYKKKAELLQYYSDYLMELEKDDHLFELLEREKNECLWDENFKNKHERHIFDWWKEKYPQTQMKFSNVIKEYNDAQRLYEEKKEEERNARKRYNNITSNVRK